jgi:hypothetical protein
MTAYVKDAGVWKPLVSGRPWVRDAGVWKQPTQGYVKDAGVWKPFLTIPKALTRIGTQSTSTGQTVSTFTVDFGAAEATKVAILAIGARSSNSSDQSVTSVSFGGTTGTLVVENDQSNAVDSSIWAAALPAGGSMTVTITGNNRSQTAITAYHLIGTGVSTTPFHTASQRAGTPSVALNIPSDGVAIGVISDDSTGDHTWIGLTEHFDASVGGTRSYSFADATGLAAQTGRTISVSGGSTKGLAVASW